MKKLKIKNWLLVFSVLGFLIFAAMPVYPATGGVLAEYDPAKIPALENPLQFETKGADSASKKISVYAGGGIQVVLGIVGSLSLVMFLYAGIRYMLARGNADEAKAAGSIMVWAALGLFVIFSSYVILQFIFKTLTG